MRRGEHLDKTFLYNEYITKGKSMNSIAKECGVSASDIYNRLRFFKIKTRNPQGRGYSSSVRYKDREWLYGEYVTEGKSSHKIAHENNWSHQTILRRLAMFGIDPRPGSSTKLTWTEKREQTEKECVECGKLLPISEFVWAICGWNARCTPCRRKMDKERKQWVNDIKTQRRCCLCGESREFALEFHHTDPKKKIAAISALAFKMDKERALAEIDKCVVLCRNCHAGVHAHVLPLPSGYRVPDEKEER